MPGEVRGHGPFDQPIPQRFVVEIAHRPLDGVKHVVGVVVGEGEAVALVGIYVEGLDAVPEAAGLPDDGDGPVAHGDHLAEAAGLELAGHEEHVRAGVDPVGQRFVHLHPGGHPAGVFPLGGADEVLIVPVAHAQEHQLHVLAHDVVQHPLDEVQALLGGEPGDEADEGRLRTLLQAALLLQARLQDGLAPPVVAGEGDAEESVVLRVVGVGVDAVQYAREHVLPLLHEAVQPLAVVGGLDLLGVGGAHGGDPIGEHDAALHAGEEPIELQIVRGEVALVEAQVGVEPMEVEEPLELQIVDGVDRADPAVPLVDAVLGPKQHAQQPALPVVAVEDVWEPTDPGQGL